MAHHKSGMSRMTVPGRRSTPTLGRCLVRRSGISTAATNRDNLAAGLSHQGPFRSRRSISPPSSEDLPWQWVVPPRFASLSSRNVRNTHHLHALAGDNPSGTRAASIGLSASMRPPPCRSFHHAPSGPFILDARSPRRRFAILPGSTDDIVSVLHYRILEGSLELPIMQAIGLLGFAAAPSPAAAISRPTEFSAELISTTDVAPWASDDSALLANRRTLRTSPPSPPPAS